MADKISKEKRSKIMSAIRAKNTKPELALRRALWAQGIRYRIHYNKEKIDIAFPSKKVAVFVDGCFWHGCPEHGHTPKSNQKYWIPKLEKNKQRAIKKDERLKNAGWKVMHFWEHEIDDLNPIIQKIKKTLNKKLD
ncbi:MAG: very short patch repair endonuclease [Candidatus Bathyarchaeota archaeon]|nr:very short patch repair endonuclease [Candidatus Bathyarchaeum tardum]WGM89289.1 MAG: very short patch repair endonuclease [Candidatus Bathyarchaeum tardum]